MDRLFDLFFDATIAWQQVGLIAGGLILALIGVALLLWFAQIFMRGEKVKARLVAVRAVAKEKSGDGISAHEMYYPVYEYKNSRGETVRAEGNGGSSIIGNKVPGKVYNGYIMKGREDVVERPSFWLFLFALLFSAPGVFMIWMGMTKFPFNIYTAIFVVFILAWAVRKIRGIIKPRDEWETKNEFQGRMRQKRMEKREQGQILSETEIRARIHGKKDFGGRMTVPLMAFLGIIFIATGLYFIQDTRDFIARAAQAEGRVVRLEYDSGSGSDSDAYYPVVSFSVPGRGGWEFRDRIGTNPPMYRQGEEVPVFYDPENPQKAMIDRGIFNLAFPGIFALVGAGLFIGALVVSSRTRRRV